MANEYHKKMLKDMKMKDDIEPGTTHNITVTLEGRKNSKRDHRCSDHHESG